MFTHGSPLYYFSAIIAVVGTIGYHCLIKRIPSTVDPMVSILGIYMGVVLVGLVSLPFFDSTDKIILSFRQLGWVQAGVALSVILIDLGFILMYRSGWDLSIAYVVTGFVISVALMVIGAFFLSERLSPINLIGVLLCIVGVAMIGYSERSEKVEMGIRSKQSDIEHVE